MALAKMVVPEETIKLFKSFHQEMKAKICLEGKTVAWREQTTEWAQTGLLCGTCVVQSLYLPVSGEMAGQSLRSGQNHQI